MLAPAQIRSPGVRPSRLIALLSAVTMSSSLLAQAGGWKSKGPVEIDGNVVADITQGMIRYRHNFGFLPNNAHSEQWRGPGKSGNDEYWEWYQLPYGPGPLISHGPPVAHEDGLTQSDWILPVPTYNAATNKTSVNMSAYAWADAARPIIWDHFEQMATAEAHSEASVAGHDLHMAAAALRIRIHWRIPKSLALPSIWCNVDISSDVPGEDPYVLNSSMDSSFLIDVDGVNQWSLGSNFYASGGGRASAHDGDGLRLVAPPSGSAGLSATIVDPFSTDNCLQLSASLSNGVFSASQAWSNLPWELTYQGNDVIAAYLPASDDGLYEWTSSNIVEGNHDLNMNSEDLAKSVRVVPGTGTAALLLVAALHSFRRRR